jgi:hypothetical protein
LCKAGFRFTRDIKKAANKTYANIIIKVLFTSNQAIKNPELAWPVMEAISQVEELILAAYFNLSFGISCAMIA